jgi:hypothetical protein
MGRIGDGVIVCIYIQHWLDCVEYTTSPTTWDSCSNCCSDFGSVREIV